jgi:3-hydroxyisobutyrate dehydrogenase
MTSNIQIGWIGTGVMGAAMCGRLLRAGYSMQLYTRSPVKAAELIKRGAHWHESPAAVAGHSDVLFTTVGAPEEVRSVYFGEDGIFEAVRPGTVIVDMGTTPPSLAVEIAGHALGREVQTVDAPVSGGDVGAREGTLSVMAGGDEKVVSSLQPLFDHLAGSVTWLGPAGSGQHTKMANQITVAGTMIGVSEALVYAVRSGVDAERLVAAIARGAAGCWTLDNLAPRILREDFEPGFMVDHFVKDLGIALAETRNMGIELPGLALAEKLYRELQQQGRGSSGTQALVHAIRQGWKDPGQT